MLRVTWEKTRNPYVRTSLDHNAPDASAHEKIRLFTAFQRPSLPIYREVKIMRPPSSSRANLPPVKGLLFFDGSEEAFAQATEIVVDFPGGGFIAMGPDCHEERLRRWAKRTGKPVLGIDYGKAPECGYLDIGFIEPMDRADCDTDPYPWAIEEGFDAYRTLMETKGSCIGIKSGKLSAVLTGDSA
jgi:acetyl esterase/lipase